MWWTSSAERRSSVPAAISARPSLRKASRRVRSLDIAFPQFFGEVLGRAPCQRDDGVGGILVGVADEWRGVGDKQVLHLVSLAILVQRARFRVVAHADGADF